MRIRDRIAGQTIRIHFPKHLAANMLPLLISEQAEFEALLGGPIAFVEQDPEHGPRWIVVEDATLQANTLRWDAEASTFTSLVQDAAGLGATLQLAHSLVALGVDELNDNREDTLPEAVARISIEAARGYPGFAIRNLSWDDIRSGFPPDDQMTLEDLQRLIACLQDGHTAVREIVPVYNPPYAVEFVAETAVIRRVPAWSAAGHAGVAPGWQLEIDNIDDWRARTGSPPHSLAFVAARRAIALNGITERDFTAMSPEGERITWTEIAAPFTLEQLIQSEVVASDMVFIRMHNWIDGAGIVEKIDQIIAANSHRQTMVMDLRSNTGGNLLMAKQMRRRFLRQRTLIGTIQFTQADGSLAAPVEIWEDPAEHGRWPGDLVVLTDALTYSASEDFLHGLQGLPHVTVIGAPSGGGSGRPRSLPVVPGWSLSMSTALTFDRSSHCIEGQGIPVDIAVDPFTEQWQQHVMPPAE